MKRAGRRALACALTTAGTLAAVLGTPAIASADRNFTPRFSVNDTGSIRIAANTLMTCPAAAANCTSGLAGAAQNNNSFNMGYVDRDGVAATFNSSSATLDLPDNTQVLFAGLYWGADATAGANGGRVARDASLAARSTVRIRAPGADAYTTLGPAGTVLDTATGTNPGRYQGHHDVTELVRAAGAGTYTVADVQAGTGADRYAGWALVVAYRDSTQPARNLTIFDGFKTINASDPPTTIPVTGFTTPPAGAVRTTLGFVTYEGDRGLVGDTARLDGRRLGDATSPVDNVFNSSIATFAANVRGKDPDVVNQLGFDADRFDANAYLGNDATSAVIGLTTSGDAYYPGALSFATELYAPNIQSTKTVENLTRPSGPAQRGDRLRYTLGYRNDGQDRAVAFIARDQIPAGTSYVPGSLRVLSGPGAGAKTDAAGDDQAEYDADNARVVLRLGTGASGAAGGSIAPAATTSYAFEVTIDPAVRSRARIVNQGSARYLGESLGTPLTDLSPEAVTDVAAPDLTVSKVHDGAFTAGARTTFAITVRNDGDLATDGSTVTLRDAFSAGAAGFDDVAVRSAPGWTCDLAAPADLTCTRADALAPGDAYPPVEVDARVHDPAPASLVNVASVEGGGDSDPSNSSGVDAGEGTQAADVQIVKTSTLETVFSGARIGFDLVVRNGGPSTAADVVVSDPLDAAGYRDVEVRTDRGSCDAAVECRIGALAAGEEARIRIDATVTANAATVTNAAAVSTATPDPVRGNDRAEASFTVPNTADLRLTKRADTDAPQAGQPDGLTYVLAVENLGPGGAEDLVVVDSLPAQFTPTAVDAPGFACDPLPAAGGELRCTRAALAVADGPAELRVTGTVAASIGARPLDNGARVRSSTADADLENNVATTTTFAAGLADLAVVKAGPATPIAPGEQGVFTMTAINEGPSDATGVELVDELNARLTFVSADPACSWDATTRRLTCPVGDLAVGEQRSFALTVRAPADAAATTILNRATVSGDQPDPVAANNRGQDNVVVSALPLANLRAGKTATPLDPEVGQATTFRLSVENAGEGRAYGVTLADELPDGFVVVSLPRACTELDGVVACAAGDLPARSSPATFDLALRPGARLAGRRVTNTVTVAQEGPDADPADDRASATLTVRAPATDPVDPPTTEPRDPPTGPTPPPTPSQPAPPGGGVGGQGDQGERGDTPPARPRGGRSARRARLRVTKTPHRRAVRAGEVVRYRIVLRSRGPVAARAVRVCDRLPAGLVFVSARGAAFRNGRACWRIAAFAPRRTRTLTVVARAEQTQRTRRVTNTVRVTARNAAARTVRAPAVRIAPRPVERPGGVVG